MLSCETFKNSYFEKHLLPNYFKDYFQTLLTQLFSCEFCELFKNTYFVENLQTVGSETPARGLSLNKVASLTT